MKYTKIGFSAIFAIFCAYAVAVSPANALVIGGGDTGGQTTGNGGDTSAPAAAPVAPTIGNGGDTSGPAVGNGGNTSAPATGNGGDTSGPAIGNGGSTAGPAIGNGGDTSTRGTGNGGDTSGPAIGNGGDTSGSGSTGGNGNGGSNGGSTGGGSTSGGGSTTYGSGGGSRRTSSGSSSVVPTLTNITNCGYITTYMKMGADNDTNEVTKLQTFLKNTEKLDVDINGIFDEKTLNAVKAFQEKYVNDVMAPWGVTSPTGQVYFTTQKKVNEIYCKSNFALTAEQLASIEAYKKGIQDGTITVNTNGEVVSTTTGSDNSSTTASASSTDNSLTASAAGASIFSKIWSFIKWLFGYNR